MTSSSGAISGSRASTEPVPVSALSGFDPERIKRHLLERYCDERCAQCGDVGCWAVAPDEGFCGECIDDADLAIAFMGQAIAIEEAIARQGND
jgi:hypothetical protein